MYWLPSDYYGDPSPSDRKIQVQKNGILTKVLIGTQIWCSSAIISLLIYKSNLNLWYISLISGLVSFFGGGVIFLWRVRKTRKLIKSMRRDLLNLHVQLWNGRGKRWGLISWPLPLLLAAPWHCHWKFTLGCLGGSVVERLPLAQVVILRSWDQVLHQTPHRSLLLPLPVSLPLCVCLS